MTLNDRVPPVAVVGAGRWGSNLIRNFAALGALVAVVDSDDQRAEAEAAIAGVASQRLDGVLSSPEIAGVAIATPAVTHAELAERALRAGKHVFVEKPLAMRVADASRVTQAAEEADRVLMVGHLLRYHPAFESLHRLVAAGELGSLQYVSSTRLSFGRIRNEENALWSFAPHDISMILALVGDEPSTVTAVGSTHLQTSIPDVTTTHLSFPGGQGAHIHVSWLHPIKEQRLVVVGDRGMAIFDDGQPWQSKLQLFRHRIDWRNGMPTPTRSDGESIALQANEPLLAECAHFLECIGSGKRPLSDGDEGLRVLRVLERAQDSLETVHHAAVTGRGDTAPNVHPTATIDDGVVIGEGTRVWHYSHVLSGTRIGARVSLGQNVMVGPNVHVGDGCRIQNNVSVYEGVTLEEDVFCGPSMVFTNVRTPRAGWDRRREFEPTRVKTGASIGANATIVCGVTLGAYSMIAAGAVVTSDVPPHALMVGVPARQVGWVSHAGERLGADLVCPRTSDRYRTVEGRLLRQ
jgi:UDP-2-acetamido-3-amino-2,3-dideoxy-glucuronate N-acetyltransferase